MVITKMSWLSVSNNKMWGSRLRIPKTSKEKKGNTECTAWLDSRDCAERNGVDPACNGSVFSNSPKMRGMKVDGERKLLQSYLLGLPSHLMGTHSLLPRTPPNGGGHVKLDMGAASPRVRLFRCVYFQFQMIRISTVTKSLNS